MKENSTAAEFIPGMKKWEAIAALVYLPLHIFVIPLLAVQGHLRGWYGEAEANFICYAVGALFMLLVLGRFLRRDFDPFMDRPLACVLEVASSYLYMMGFNLILNMALSFFAPVQENPNNQAVFGLAEGSFGMVSAMAVFLAPIVEELIFRGGIFALLYPVSRRAAYLTGMLLFSVYHVWSYAATDPTAWIYLLQYLPVSFLLCRCYERCRSIWGPIFLHMLINAISMNALKMLEGLV